MASSPFRIGISLGGLFSSVNSFMRRRVRYQAIPAYNVNTQEGGARPGPLRQRYRTTIRTLMTAIGLALVTMLVLSFVGPARPPAYSPSPEACDTIDQGYQCNTHIAHSWGQYSPYFSVPSEIETGVPEGCELTFAHVLSRHGARDPTFVKSVMYRAIIAKIHLLTTSYGPGYEFIRDYNYTLGADQLTPFGEQQLVHSGRSFFSRYSSLARRSQPFIRASGQDRVVHSAEKWVEGFHQALLDGSFPNPPRLPYPMVIVPERPGANNTLSNKLCTAFTSGTYSRVGEEAASTWLEIFAPPIVDRLNKHLIGANLTTTDIPLIMDLCPFETVASQYGYTLSPFCNLFDANEWSSYDYYQSLGKWYGYGPGNALGPTQGVGWVNELLARLTERPVEDNTSTNRTLDGSDEYFPLGRGLYADFSHDNEMMSVLGALGVYEGVRMPNVTKSGPTRNGGFSSSWAVPFAARVYVEKMKCSRSSGDGEELVRILVNDRVVPVKGCPSDDLGRCPLSKFVESMEFSRQGGRWDLCFK